MLDEISEITVRTQLVLEEMFAEGSLPFRLSAQIVECIGDDEFIVRFHDSRLHSVDLSWQHDQCFEEVFRAAMLARVDRLRDSVQYDNR
jgi:hypothetical protein